MQTLKSQIVVYGAGIAGAILPRRFGDGFDVTVSSVAAADEGSFSAAGRRLGRAQSVVSQTLANMEAQLGVRLFDRSGRIPALTETGRALLPDARAVAGNIDAFKARARPCRRL